MTSAIKSVEWRVANLDCEHDAAALRRGLADWPGLLRLDVYPKSAKVKADYDPERTSGPDMRARLAEIGFPTVEGQEPPGQPQPWRNPKVLASCGSGVLVLLGWLAGHWPETAIAAWPLSVTAIVVGGYFFGREAIEDLIFERRIGIEMLMSVAAVVAALLGQPVEGAMLVFLYSISEAAEGYTEEKTRSAIKALMALAPKVALVKRQGREVEIPIEELVVGDVFIARPGQSMATDGEILEGSSSVNEAPVTGESVPAEKRPGDRVFAGTINGEAALEVKATHTHADNTLARIVHMVEEAQERRGQSQRFIERFGAWYSPAVLGLGVLAAVTLAFVLGLSWHDALVRATVFIVAAAPCALVISIPITMVAALGTAARHGVLIKGGVFVEELGRVSVVALDKTGTLTRGEPEVTDVRVLDREGEGPTSEADLLAWAAAVERRSEHPLARAIVSKAEEAGLDIPAVADFRAMTGAGATALVGGRHIHIGSPALFEAQLKVDLSHLRTEISGLQDAGKTVILLGDGRRVWGLLALRDNLRPGARETVAALRGAGIRHVVMLTGDNARTARAIAVDLGVDEVCADLKPADKVAQVRALARTHGPVAMVGDGVNDAPALAEAAVGVAMGAAGTDVALETADVALMADDLKKLVFALQLARRTQAIVNQNLALSTFVIGALILGAVTGVFSLPVVVVAHEVSEFLVIASGLRILRARP
jgi:heavy metal translocating P-type ATPase